MTPVRCRTPLNQISTSAPRSLRQSSNLMKVMGASRVSEAGGVGRASPGAPCFLASLLGDAGAGGELDGDVDDHVFLTADVAGPADFLEDLPGRYAVAFRGTLGVDEEG